MHTALKFESVSVMAIRCHYHGAGAGVGTEVATGVPCLMSRGGLGPGSGWGGGLYSEVQCIKSNGE